MRTIPEQLAQLAGDCLAVSQSVSDGQDAGRGGHQVAGTSAGNTPQGPSAVQRHTAAAEAADTAFGRLVSVLEQTMDDLYATAFDMSTTDEETADRLHAGTVGGGGGGGGVGAW